MRVRILSVSASVIMMGTMLMTGNADVQPYQEEIQHIEFEQIPEAAVSPPEVTDHEAGMITRTHTVHLYTQEDAELIKRIALAEAETEGADGLWMVMSCIINRVNDPDYPDTVQDVIYQKNVFSSLKDGNFAKAAATSDEAEEAFARIDAGDVCPQIIAFEGLGSDALDRWFRYAFTYRKHKFYTKK